MLAFGPIADAPIAAFADAAAVAGGYGSAKKRYIQRVGDRLVVFSNATAALEAAKAQDEAEEPEEVDAEAPAVEEAQEAEIPVMQEAAQAWQEAPRMERLINAHHYADALALYQAIKMQQDEEDVELLLTYA